MRPPCRWPWLRVLLAALALTVVACGGSHRTPSPSVTPAVSPTPSPTPIAPPTGLSCSLGVAPGTNGLTRPDVTPVDFALASAVAPDLADLSQGWDTTCRGVVALDQRAPFTGDPQGYLDRMRRDDARLLWRSAFVLGGRAQPAAFIESWVTTFDAAQGAHDAFTYLVGAGATPVAGIGDEAARVSAGCGPAQPAGAGGCKGVVFRAGTVVFELRGLVLGSGGSLPDLEHVATTRADIATRAERAANPGIWKVVLAPADVAGGPYFVRDAEAGQIDPTYYLYDADGKQPQDAGVEWGEVLAISRESSTALVRVTTTVTRFTTVAGAEAGFALFTDRQAVLRYYVRRFAAPGVTLVPLVPDPKGGDQQAFEKVQFQAAGAAVQEYARIYRLGRYVVTVRFGSAQGVGTGLDERALTRTVLDRLAALPQ